MNELEDVKSAQVNFQTKQAVVEFDESRITASEIAQEVAATPHMMGKDMQYGGALQLKADRLTSRDASALQGALKKVQGVSRVTTDTRSQTVGVEFAPKSEVTTADLIDAGKRAGYTLTTLTPPASRRGRSARGGGGGGGGGMG